MSFVYQRRRGWSAVDQREICAYRALPRRVARRGDLREVS